MTLRNVQGRPTAEDVQDVADWLTALEGCPPVTATSVVSCRRHDDEAVWFYVEADATAGVARTRCLACSGVQELLDSGDRWTYPMAWSCSRCSQSIAEVVLGAHVTDGRAYWVALAVRCVDCGTVAGLTDVVVPAPGVRLSDVVRRQEPAAAT